MKNMRNVILIVVLALGACRREDRDQRTEVTVTVNRLTCTADTVEADADRPMLLTDDAGDSCSIPQGHTSHPRKGKAYRLCDGQATVARCGD